MKKYIAIAWLLSASLCMHAIQMDVSATEHSRLKLLVGVIGDDTELYDIAKIMQKDFGFSGQFDVDVQKFAQPRSKRELQRLFGDGYSLVVFINSSNRTKSIEWRIYDTSQATMVVGKKYKKRGTSIRGWAHNLSDKVWPQLTAQEGSFSTKLAYCKQVVTPESKCPLKHIYVADYDGSNEQRLIATPTVNIGPRWNQDLRNPLLFYSEIADTNIRLMVSSMKGSRKMASNFDGVNMLPSFSADGKKVVYCASRGDGNCQLYLFEKGSVKQLTRNTGNNISPSLSDDGKRLYYCSDFPSGRPGIWRYDVRTGKRVRITKQGAAFSPAYHQKTGKVAYTKMVSGAAQVFCYDEHTQEHRQLTFDAGNKEECSWSSCGNYVLFSVERGASERIAALNILTNEQRFITAAQDKCSYPAWSPAYSHYPCLQTTA